MIYIIFDNFLKFYKLVLCHILNYNKNKINEIIIYFYYKKEKQNKV